MIIKTSYIADDGTEFPTEAECVKYEAGKNKQTIQDIELLNRVCRFFNSSGVAFHIDSTFDESRIYGVRIKCSTDEVYDVLETFRQHFDDLYWALNASDFGVNSEVVLAYDWVHDSGSWKEIDYDEKEWVSFLQKVLGWA